MLSLVPRNSAIQELWEDLFDKPLFPVSKVSSDIPVDIEETDEAYLVAAELPGTNKKDIQVSVDNKILTIKAERNTEKKSKGYYERQHGKVERSFTLQENVKIDDIKADYKDGILKLNIPKNIPVKKPIKTIEIG